MPNEIITTLSATELSRICHVDRSVILSLVEFGVLSPQGRTEADWIFDQIAIQRAVRACRLERDLGLNTAGVAVVLDLLDERASLLRRIQTLTLGEI